MTTYQSKIERLIAELCPNGVEFKELGEVCKIKIGQKPDEVFAIQCKGYPYINAGLEPSGKVSTSNTSAGTISIPSRGQGGAGHVGYQSKAFWCGPLCYKIISKNNISITTKYFFYYLTSVQDSLIALRKIGSIPAINKTDLVKIKIPIPPLPIQQEIVKILDTFTELEAELEAELEVRKKQYEYYREELLNGKKYQEVEIADLGRIITGRTPSSSQRNCWGDGIDFITPSDMQSDSKAINKTARSLSSDGNAKVLFKNNILPANSILVSCIGSDMGKTVMNINTAVTNQQINSIIVEMKNVIPDYIYHYLASKKDYLQMLGGSGGGTMPIINKSNFMKIIIPIPPLAEQERIVAILDKFDALVNDISIGLPAELKARRQQYEYYREKLLTFKTFEK